MKDNVSTQNTALLTCVFHYTQTLPPGTAGCGTTLLANHRVQAVLLQTPIPLLSHSHSCCAG